MVTPEALVGPAGVCNPETESASSHPRGLGECMRKNHNAGEDDTLGTQPLCTWVTCSPLSPASKDPGH